MKFIHAADVHLDSPLRGLERYEGAPLAEIRGASRRAFENLVELCIRTNVDFLLIAGDLYDGALKDFNAVLYFVKWMVRLREAGIRVFLVRGNHDPANWFSRHAPLPDNVYEFPANRAATVCLDELRVALHGRSYPRRDVQENLAVGYPAPVSGYFNIGLLHTALDGREGHDGYAPCTVDELAAKGYDYWALGHVHAWEVIRSEGSLIVFPGNLQGRHIRETGAKGCALVQVDAAGAVGVEPCFVDLLRWVVVEVNAGGAVDPDALLERTRTALQTALAGAEGRMLAARLLVTGRCPAHAAMAREALVWSQRVRLVALDVGEGMIWLEKVVIRTEPPVVRRVVGDTGNPLDLLAGIRAELATDEAQLAELMAAFQSLRSMLPAELLDGPDALRLDDPDWFRERMGAAEAVAVSRLLEGEE